MNYQAGLFSRKGRFGVVWWAAHYPNKLTRAEVIRLNIEGKCKEIMEFVGNKKANRPKFSLVTSSHLLFGLVILLNKQTNYLLDELNEFSLQMRKTYTLTEPKKSPSKRAKVQDRSTLRVNAYAVTMRENLPEMLDIDMEAGALFSLDQLEMNLNFDAVAAQRSRITLDEDYMEERHLIPVETEDMFEPIADMDFMDRFIEGAGVYDTENIDVNLERTVQGGVAQTYTSTEKKRVSFDVRSTFRPALGELSTNVELRRLAQDKHATSAQFGMDSTLEATLIPSPARMEPGFAPLDVTRPTIGLPQLFEDISAHFDQEMPPAPEIPEAHTPAAVTFDEEPMDAEGMIPRTISFELNQLIEKRSEKAEARERLAARKRHLIIDINTKLTDAEMLRLIHLPAPRAHAAEAERERAELDELFAKGEHWLKTKNDFMLGDPTLFPLNRLAARPRVFAPVELKQSQHYKILQANKNLVTSKLAAEPRKEREVRRPPTVTGVDLTEIEHPTPMETERARRKETEEASGAGLLAVEKTIKRTSVLKGSLLGEGTLLPHQLEDTISAAQMTMEQHDTIPLVPPTFAFDSFEESRLVEIHPPPPLADEELMPPPPEQAAPAPEAPSAYRDIILDELRERGPFDLRDVIKTHELPASMKTYSKTPRRLFACKMFMATLNLAGKRQITVSQEECYEAIIIQEV